MTIIEKILIRYYAKAHKKDMAKAIIKIRLLTQEIDAIDKKIEAKPTLDEEGMSRAFSYIIILTMSLLAITNGVILSQRLSALTAIDIFNNSQLNRTISQCFSFIAGVALVIAVALLGKAIARFYRFDSTVGRHKMQQKGWIILGIILFWVASVYLLNNKEENKIDSLAAVASVIVLLEATFGFVWLPSAIEFLKYKELDKERKKLNTKRYNEYLTYINSGDSFIYFAEKYNKNIGNSIPIEIAIHPHQKDIINEFINNNTSTHQQNTQLEIAKTSRIDNETDNENLQNNVASIVEEDNNFDDNSPDDNSPDDNSPDDNSAANNVML